VLNLRFPALKRAGSLWQSALVVLLLIAVACGAGQALIHADELAEEGDPEMGLLAAPRLVLSTALLAATVYLYLFCRAACAPRLPRPPQPQLIS
jgi:hypothetical protein